MRHTSLLPCSDVSSIVSLAARLRPRDIRVLVRLFDPSGLSLW